GGETTDMQLRANGDRAGHSEKAVEAD
ncbi:hypothetical protein E3A20_25430, partial [Planctomyces bekefii]